MADFINFEAEHNSDESTNEENEILSDIDSFINDESKSENESEYVFRNVEVDLEQPNREALARGLKRIENFDEYSNLCGDSDDDEEEINEFEKSKILIDQFKKVFYHEFVTMKKLSIMNSLELYYMQ